MIQRFLIVSERANKEILIKMFGQEQIFNRIVQSSSFVKAIVKAMLIERDAYTIIQDLH